MNKSPLPPRNGVNATRLKLPADTGAKTVIEYLLTRFGHMDPEEIIGRMRNGEIVAGDGTPLTMETTMEEYPFCWYYRSAPNEEKLPVEYELLYQDKDLVVIDKPHFLPTTPGGRYIQETALVRLRNHLDLPQLVPIHRLDRATAGILLFAANPQTRGAYQQLFERQQVGKHYLCVSALQDRSIPAGSVQVRNHIRKEKGVLRSVVTERADGAPAANSVSDIKLLAEGFSGGTHAGRRVGLFSLTPLTGKTHQLRIHMATLGLGILNDPFYPILLDKAPDDYTRPLQLLAESIWFTDPLSGKERRFSSGRELLEAPLPVA